MSSNIYYSPEKFRLEQVAMIDYSDGDYCFDYRVIWRHLDTGVLYTARDSGCSCPSPFESYTNLHSLDRFLLSQVENEVKSVNISGYYRGSDTTEFLSKIRRLSPSGPGFGRKAAVADMKKENS